ncbi:MAG: T9SS type A sorting domain-containing protein [Candidatus Zixiibacteriota bacterium]
MTSIKIPICQILVSCLLIVFFSGIRLSAGEGDAAVIELTDKDKARLFYYALEDAINNPSAENLANLYTNIDKDEKTDINEKVTYFSDSRSSFEEKSGFSIKERLFIKPFIADIKDNTLFSTAEITYQAENYLSCHSFQFNFEKANNFLELKNTSQILDSINHYVDIQRSSIFNKEIPEPDTTFAWIDYDTLHIVQDYHSDNMLNPINFSTGDNMTMSRFTTTESKNKFNNNIIFGIPANTLALRLYDTLIQQAAHEFLMITDPAWNRIIAADRIKEWLFPFGSYGTAINEFRQPQSMAFVYNYFIIADAYNYRALVYNFYSDGSYDFVQSIQNNNGCIKDVAAAWYDDLSKHVAVLDFDNARVDLCSLVTALGNFHFELNRSLYGCDSGYLCLDRPTSICYGRFFNQLKDAPVIYITDAGNNRVLCRYLESPLTYNLRYNFPDNSFLTSVDVDYFGNSYVVDKYNCNIYKFDRQRDLLVIYGSKGEGNNQLLYPLSVNVGKTWKSDETGMYYVPTGDIFVNEYFAENTGIRRYLPGVDVLWTAKYTQTWPNLSQYCRIWVFWHQTETANCHKKLFRNDTLVIDYGTELVLADDIIYDYVDFHLDTLSNGLYSYEVNAKAYYDALNDTTIRFDQYIAHPEIPQDITCDSCGGAQGAQVSIHWDSVDVTGATHFDIFRDDSFLVSVPSSQTYYFDRAVEPGVIYKYKIRSRWEFNWFSGFTAIDSATPSGYVPNAPSNVVVTRNSTTCGWTISWDDNSDNEKFFKVSVKCIYTNGTVQNCTYDVPADSTSMIYWNNEEGTDLEFFVNAIDSNNCHNCTFEDPYGCYLISPPSNTATAHVGICVPPTCPYLYVWNGQDFRIENNLLGASNTYNILDSSLLEFHFVEVTPQPINGYFKFLISEKGTDVSTFDQLGLFMIDNSSGNKMFLDKSARAYSIVANYKPSHVIDHLGYDITHLVEYDDGRYYYSGSPGYLIAEFDSLPVYDALKSDIDGGAISDPPIKDATQPQTKDGIPDELIHNRLYLFVDYNGEWIPVDTVHGLAFNRRNFYTSLKDYISEDGKLRLKYQWTLEYLADNISYVETQKLYYFPIRLPLKSAKHSRYGDVTLTLYRTDLIESSLLAGDTISALFAAPLNVNPENNIFILVATGRYSSSVNNLVRDLDVMKADSALLPKCFAFDQNYPNPFNPSTTFKFALPQAEHVSLNIYNILGQMVGTLIDKDYDAGYHSILWSNNDLGSGVYFAKFQAGDFKSTRKVVIVK